MAKDEKNRLKGKTDGLNMGDRKFTDIFFCLFFILFIGLLIAISVYSYVIGDPNRLKIKFDSDGNQCGLPS